MCFETIQVFNKICNLYMAQNQFGKCNGKPIVLQRYRKALLCLDFSLDFYSLNYSVTSAKEIISFEEKWEVLFHFYAWSGLIILCPSGFACQIARLSKESAGHYFIILYLIPFPGIKLIYSES